MNYKEEMTEMTVSQIMEEIKKEVNVVKSSELFKRDGLLYIRLIRRGGKEILEIYNRQNDYNSPMRFCEKDILTEQMEESPSDVTKSWFIQMVLMLFTEHTYVTQKVWDYLPKMFGHAFKVISTYDPKKAEMRRKAIEAHRRYVDIDNYFLMMEQKRNYF